MQLLYSNSLCYITTTNNFLEFEMAKNPPIGDSSRVGAVRQRSQVHNPKTDTWTKRNTENGRFMDQKQDSTPFEGVRKEQK